jgi:hypothetical protein
MRPRVTSTLAKSVTALGLGSRSRITETGNAESLVAVIRIDTPESCPATTFPSAR